MGASNYVIARPGNFIAEPYGGGAFASITVLKSSTRSTAPLWTAVTVTPEMIQTAAVMTTQSTVTAAAVSRRKTLTRVIKVDCIADFIDANLVTAISFDGAG